ncbi:MAG: hypothetical protein HOW73_17175 [Polyangiaceae bacterium]|nr:hypothetical protein [Polyangiaceae bacterium]
MTIENKSQPPPSPQAQEVERRDRGEEPRGAGYVERSETGRGGSHVARFAGGERGAEEPERRGPIPTTALFTFGAWGLSIMAIGLVGTSVAPAVLREMGLTEIHVVRRDFQRTTPVGQLGVDAVRDFERDIGNSLDRMERGADDADEIEDLFVIFTRKAVKLKKSPSAGSPVESTVPAGSRIVVLRPEGPWLQVKFEAADRSVHSGWVELKELDQP